MPTVSILPAVGRPHRSPADLERILSPFAIDLARHPLVIVGIRGFFAQAGERPGNERNLYDDALFIFAPSLGICCGFNGNTDPSKVRLGSGFADGSKGMASLTPGAWLAYRFDKHKGDYEAICQRAGQVTVMRDGRPPYPETGNFGINIHHGGYHTTSSEGCQTLPPTQWEEFIALAQQAAQRLFGLAWRERTLYYVLTDAEAPPIAPDIATTSPQLPVQGQSDSKAERFRRETIRPTLQRMGCWSENAEALLLGTALVESDLANVEQFRGGPALGYFQMEPATHADNWRYLEQRRSALAAIVRQIAGTEHPEAELMLSHPAYACAMARVHYLRVPDPIPPAGDIEALAAYWKQFYNTPNGAGRPEAFVEKWRKESSATT